MQILSRCAAVLIACAALCIPATADDNCSSDSGQTLCSGEDGEDNPVGEGGHGGDTTEDHIYFVSDGSQDASVGAIAGNGGDGLVGGDGGDVQGKMAIHVDSPDVTETFEVHALAGDGGAGGAPATSGNGGSTAPVEFVTTAVVRAEGLFASTNGGSGAKGGDAGDITANLDGVASEVKVTSRGGAANVGVGGDGGDLSVALRGDFDVVYISTKQGGLDDRAGHAGDINVVVTGTVGNMMAESGDDFDQREGGTVRVVLQDGAMVTGTIYSNEEADSTLVFQFSVADRGEFARASRAIESAAGLGGTVTVNGQVYAWVGFDALANLLTLTASNGGGGSSVEIEIKEPSAHRFDRILERVIQSLGVASPRRNGVDNVFISLVKSMGLSTDFRVTDQTYVAGPTSAISSGGGGSSGYIYADGTQVGQRGECVSLVSALTGLSLAASTWGHGDNARNGTLHPGDPIATFGSDGRYSGQHAAVFVDYIRDRSGNVLLTDDGRIYGAYLLDQNNSPGVEQPAGVRRYVFKDSVAYSLATS